MVTLTIAITMIALSVAYATALPGALLFVRGASLLSDAISHSVLLGIAVMFLFVQSLTSMWLFVGASMAGVLTVIVTQLVMQTRRLSYDASIGVVFPCFFAIGVVIISLYARNVHLDIDMVALGEIAFAPLYRMYLFGYDVGPYALWTTGIAGVTNTICIASMRKEIAAAIFDHQFAYVIGLRPTFIYYLLMVMASITAVAAFEVVGSVVVVALMTAPAATAYLMTRRFTTFLLVAPLVGMVSAIAGYALARVGDVSIAGSISVMAGAICTGVLMTSPYGVLRHRHTDAHLPARDIIVSYLRSRDNMCAPCHLIADDLAWSMPYLMKVVQADQGNSVVRVSGDKLYLVE